MTSWAINSSVSRRRAFKAAVTLLGQSMGSAAADFGVSYNHLVLVLDGKRGGSARLERAIAERLQAAALVLSNEFNRARVDSTPSLEA